MTDQEECMSNDELLEELKRVGSDIGFRLRTRRILQVIGGIAVVALIAACISVGSIIAVRHFQIQGCNRDNALRKAYTDQWSPVLRDSPPPTKPPEDAPQAAKDAYAAQVRQRVAFEKGLEGFAQHPC